MILEMIENENKALIRKGRREGIKDVAKNMLKEKIDIKLISKLTGLSETKIKKLK